MAIKAVANGCPACGLVKSIAFAVGCSVRHCDDQVQAVVDTVAFLKELQSEMDDLKKRLQDEFELKVEPEWDNDSWMRKLLKRLNFARRAGILLAILWDFLNLVEQTSSAFVTYQNDVANLIDCINKEEF
jgi:hypothetical protein